MTLSHLLTAFSLLHHFGELINGSPQSQIASHAMPSLAFSFSLSPVLQFTGSKEDKRDRRSPLLQKISRTATESAELFATRPYALISAQLLLLANSCYC